MLTWTFAVQRVVMLVMRVPETPGGFNDSIACRLASSSATAEDMLMKEQERDAVWQLSSINDEDRRWLWKKQKTARKSSLCSLCFHSDSRPPMKLETNEATGEVKK